MICCKNILNLPLNRLKVGLGIGEPCEWTDIDNNLVRVDVRTVSF
jgi:hypothetical protein